MDVRAARGRVGDGRSQFNGITKENGELNKKARFQLFKAPFFFVGWLAPATGIGAANSNSTKGKTQSIQRDHKRLKASKKKARFQFFGAFKVFVGWLAPATGLGAANSNRTKGKAQPIPTVQKERRSQFNGITKENGELNKKARFQLFKAPFFFVGWLAPATGIGTANSNNTKGKAQPIPTLYRERRSQFQQYKGKGAANSTGSQKTRLPVIIAMAGSHSWKKTINYNDKMGGKPSSFLIQNHVDQSVDVIHVDTILLVHVCCLRVI